MLGARPRAQILLEASTDSEWVARGLDVGTSWEGGNRTEFPTTGADHAWPRIWICR